MEIKVAIIGAGISSAFFGFKFKQLCNEADIDLKLAYYSLEFNGGACGDIPYRYKKDKCIYIHAHGPHIFHTNNEEVWKLVSQVAKFIPFNLQVKALMEGNIVPLPFSLKTIEQCFPAALQLKIEQALLASFKYDTKITLNELKKHGGVLSILADYMYNHMFAKYTAKQWGISVDEIDPSVLNRVPFAFSNQTSYFTDKWQALPCDGYTNMINCIIRLTGSQRIPVSKAMTINNNKELADFDYVVSSASIDEFFDYQFGELPYRTCKFYKDIYRVYHKNGEHVINYPNQSDYTRSADYGNWYNLKNKHITVFEEPRQWTRESNDLYPRYYPINNAETEALYNKYKDLLKQYSNVRMIGRLGLYKYINMDTAIEIAINSAKELFAEIK